MGVLVSDTEKKLFAKMLVHEYIANDPSDHYNFFRFIKSRNDRLLFKHVKKETIQALLDYVSCFKRIPQHSITNLSNFGAWLGRITVGDNKPLTYKVNLA